MRRSDITVKDVVESGEQPEFDLLAAFQTDEANWGGSTLLNSDEHKYYVDAFSRSGFTGGINWYRNFTRNWERSQGVEQRIEMPSLMIMAENDLVLPPSAADGMEEHCADLEKVLIKGSGHWTQQEKPEDVSIALTQWLKRKFD